MSAVAPGNARALAVVVAALEDSPTSREDVWHLVALIPGSELRGVVRILAEEVAVRVVAPAEDRAVALDRFRAQLVEAAARG